MLDEDVSSAEEISFIPAPVDAREAGFRKNAKLGFYNLSSEHRLDKEG
jgi:hypothetical protein